SQEVGDSAGAAPHEDRPSSRNAEQPRRSRGDVLPRTEDASADHDDRRHRDSGRDRDRERDRQRNRQPGPEANFSPRQADGGRRDSRPMRESPGQFDRNDSHAGSHQPKRARDDSISDVRLEPPHQRQATPTSISSVREASPATATAQAAGALASSNVTPPVSQAAKPSNEEVDRKRKELRAQLLKQQEEKQKQKDEPPLSVAVSAERRERDARGNSSRHSSRERAGVAESKEGGSGSGRRGRRISSRQIGASESMGQQQSDVSDSRDRNANKQQQQPSRSNTSDRSGQPTQMHSESTSAQDRQQQQSRVQPQVDTVATQSSYVDRNGRRTGRGGESNRNNSTPLRDDRHALADEPVSIRISGGRQAAKAEASRSAGSGAVSDSNANGSSRRGPKRGRGGAENRDWNDGGKRYRK
ncbi:hypothetical protein IWW38_003768, partial [Coemansia aciculifera]